MTAIGTAPANDQVPCSQQELRDLDRAANLANRQEHAMSTRQALRKHWKGICWSLFISLSVVLCGFDLTVCGNLIAMPAFRKQYGYEYDPTGAPGVYLIPTPWQVGIVLGITSAQLFGAIGGGPLADRFGRKAAFYICLVGNTAFIFLQMFATSLGMLFAGAFLNGVCYGFYIVLAPTYAAEVVPYHLRNITTAFSNMGLIAGQLLGQGVTTAFVSRTDDWAYRIPFALQWFWSVVLFVGLLMCPESPWYLVHKGRFAEAESVLARLAISDGPEDMANVVAMMERTNKLEREHRETTSFLDCFKGTDLRRTEISTVPFLVQILSCSSFLNSVTYFLSLAGLGEQNAFYMGLGTFALGFVTNILCYPMMAFVGRRPTYIWGSVVVIIMLFMVGFLDLAPNYKADDRFSWAQAVILMVTFGVYMLTTGPASWVIMSETASTRLRPKTVSIAVGVQVLGTIPIAVGLPYQLNPDRANWRGKNGFFFGGLALIGLVWAYFRLPELKGRTFEEADILFETQIPAREFANHQVDVGAVHGEFTKEVKK